MSNKPRVRVKASSRPHLTVVPFTPHAIDPFVKQVADGLNEKVSSGQVVSVAIITVNVDRTISSAYVIGPDLFKLIGAVHNLQVRLDKAIEAL